MANHFEDAGKADYIVSGDNHLPRLKQNGALFNIYQLKIFDIAESVKRTSLPS